MNNATAPKSSPDSGIRLLPSEKPVRKRKTPSKAPPAFTDEDKAPRVVGGKQKAPNGVVDEVIIATAERNRLATFLGFVLGGFVPIGSFVVAHSEIKVFDMAHIAPILIVLGGLAYSALTVYEWGAKAFENRLKALGFVFLIEGIMTLSSVVELSYAALALLVCINGISTGTKLALKRTL